MNYNCPRCNYEFELDSVPSKGWVCEFCAEELGIKDEENIFAQSPTNDLEERRLEEDFDGEVENKVEAERIANAKV